MTHSPKQPAADAQPPLRVVCDHCGAELLADASDAGRKATCPDCHGQVAIPTVVDLKLRDEIAARAPGLSESPQQRREGLAKARTTFQLKDEIAVETKPFAAARAKGELAASSPSASPASTEPPLDYDLPEGHQARARFAGWLRRVILAVLALTVIVAFDAAYTAIRMRAQPSTLHDVLRSLWQAIRAIPDSLRLLSIPRAVDLATLGAFTPIERFSVAIIVLVFVGRLVVRSKLLDTMFVTTDRWAERSHGGLVYHFLALFLQVGLLAWAASIAQSEGGSDGLASALLGAYLFVSALWLMTLHLVSVDEHRNLASWALVDAISGLAVFVVVLWPGVTVLWTRAGATVVLCLANSAVALHLGAGFVFARRPKGWWWRKPLFMIASCAIVFVVACILACVR